MVVVRIESLVVGGRLEPWERLGFTVVDARIPLHGAGVRIDGRLAPGLHAWELSGLDRSPGDQLEIDGLATVIVDPSPPVFVEHSLGVWQIDHVVIATDDLERTCCAIADVTGAARRRVRQTEKLRQGFHRLGGVVVEVVEQPARESTRFFGVAFTTTDLDAAVAVAGEDLLGAPEDAVQPGRRISTVRSAAGLGVPVAVISESPGE